MRQPMHRFFPDNVGCGGRSDSVFIRRRFAAIGNALTAILRVVYARFHD
jgi:hypothetical protein